MIKIFCDLVQLAAMKQIQHSMKKRSVWQWVWPRVVFTCIWD